VILEHPENFNIDIAEKVIQQVTEHPSTHHQFPEFSHCGSAACLIGWAKLFMGLGEWPEQKADGRFILGLSTITEYYHIYGEPYKSRAIDNLRDYIEQAKAAQHVQDDELVALTEELVNA
jgi:hypothetical protein